jgi:ribosome-binding protein aMBF1 (putative translation factor)
MSDLQDLRKEQLKDTEFRAEYERTQPEFEIRRAIIAARLEKNMTQKELSVKTGIRQSNISRIERGVGSPDFATINRIAEGLGKRLIVQFQDIK